nr:NAD(P)H-binding protein [Thermosporothrix hazakensis]
MAIVRELFASGHQVLGLARSDAAATSLASIGAQVYRGSLDDLDSLRSGAAASDGVIHTAYFTTSSDLGRGGEGICHAIKALGAELAGSGRPFVVTSATGLLQPGHLGTEEDAASPGSVGGYRVASEEAALELSSRGVRVSIVRLPPTTHGEGDHGFVPTLISLARRKLYRRTQATDRIVGPLCTGLMLHTCSNWHWRRPRQDQCCMRSQTKGCQCARSQASFPAARAFRLSLCLSRKRAHTSAESGIFSHWTSRHRARRPDNGWDSTPCNPVCWRISTAITTSRTRHG